MKKPTRRGEVLFGAACLLLGFLFAALGLFFA